MQSIKLFTRQYRHTAVSTTVNTDVYWYYDPQHEAQCIMRDSISADVFIQHKSYAKQRIMICYSSMIPVSVMINNIQVKINWYIINDLNSSLSMENDF
jgi:hypothetical protein